MRAAVPGLKSLCAVGCIILFAAAALWPSGAAYAAAVPKHLVPLTVDLLRGVKEKLKSASPKSGETDIRQRAYKILRQEGLYHWARRELIRKGLATKLAAVFAIAPVGPADIPRLQRFLDDRIGGRRDAALDELYTAYNRPRPTGRERARIVAALDALWRDAWGGLALDHSFVGVRGPHRITLQWRLEDARFTVLVEDGKEGAARPTRFEITGEVRFTVSADGGDIVVAAKPLANPFRLKSGDVAVGPVAASGKGAEIAAKQKKIEEIEGDKAHIWKNSETGETVRQDRFKKLKEPFEYKGEGHADPKAPEEIARLENEIAALESGQAEPEPKTGGKPEGQPGPAEPSEPDPANAGWGSVGQEEAQPAGPSEPDPANAGWGSVGQEAQPTGPGGAQSGSVIFLAKDLYFDIVEVFHRSDAYDFSVHDLSLPEKNPTSYSKRYRRRFVGESPLMLKLGTSRVGPFKDIAFYARLEGVSYDEVSLVPTHYARVLHRAPLLPNAIKIVDGPRHPVGSKILVDVDVPEEQLERAGRYYGTGRHGTWLEVVEPARGVRGGAVIPEDSIKRYQITESHSRIDITASAYWPGFYELRLESFGYVHDRTPLLVTVDQLPGSLRLVDDKQPEVGKWFSVVFDAPPLEDLGLPNNYSRFTYSMDFFALSDDGRPVENFNHSFFRDDVQPGEPISLYPSEIPRGSGKYVVRLLFNTGPGGEAYILDHLELAMGRFQETMPYQITVAGYPTFPRYADKGEMIAQGEKIPVVFSSRRPGFEPVLQLYLYRLPAGAGNGPDVVPIGTPIVGDLIEEWPPGRDQAWLVDRNLEIGRYAFALAIGTQTIFHYFEIVPGFGKVKLSLGGKQRFQLGESVDVSLKTPEGYSAADNELSDYELYFILTPMGGHVPGCAIELPRFSMFKIAAGMGIGTSETIYPSDVGVYLLQLYKKSHLKVKLLDEVAFEVVTEPLPGSITLPDGASYRPEGEMTISIAMPAGHPSTVGGQRRPSFSILRHGAATTTGAILTVGWANLIDMPSDPELHEALVKGGGKVEFVVKAPPPGSYEARLSYGSSLLAYAPFTVVHPKSPFALDYGLESISLRNDVDAANNPWPAVGEYLSGADCEPEIFMEEEMDLRFVRWEDGRHVPIAGALNFGDAFYLEGRLENPAMKNVYFAKVGPAEGDAEEVTLFPDEDDAKVVRSELLYFIWDDPEEEADGAAQ